MKKPARTLIKKCDVLFSKIVRSKGRCEVCGKIETLQCAHIISRKNHQVRWDPDNALCLCMHHHLYWAHKEPMEFAMWLSAYKGKGFYQKLKRKSEAIRPIDHETIYEELKSSWVDIEKGSVVKGDYDILEL